MCSEKESEATEASLRNLVGGFLFEECMDYPACVRLFIHCGDFKMAADATMIELEKEKESENHDSWKHLCTPWISNSSALAFAKKQPIPVSLLVDLFNNPKAVESKRTCFKVLRRNAMKSAIAHHGLGIEGLHMFDRAAFEFEIRGELVSRYYTGCTLVLGAR